MDLIRTLMPAMAIVFTHLAGAQEQLTPATALPADPRIEADRDWSRTHLSLKPAFRAQIERARVFLDRHEGKLHTEVSRLKNEGIIHRDDRAKIRGALKHIRGSISRMVQCIETNARLDGWDARMISYELGIAADTLAQQANAIDARLNGRPSEAARPEYLVKTLEETSELMKETGRIIVHYIQ